MTKKKSSEEKTIVISAPNFKTAEFKITGTAPYVQNKFSRKAFDMMKEKQEAGSVAKKNMKKEAKDFKELYELAKHQSGEGWCGIPSPAFRNALISACKACGFAMTRAKLSIFIKADGSDKDDGTPLTKITKGEPEYSEHKVRIQNTCDIRPRPLWKTGWESVVRVTFDADQFSIDDVTHLMMRAGMQVGIGEGRPDSKSSNGMGWGTFSVEGK